MTAYTDFIQAKLESASTPSDRAAWRAAGFKFVCMYDELADSGEKTPKAFPVHPAAIAACVAAIEASPRLVHATVVAMEAN